MGITTILQGICIGIATISCVATTYATSATISPLEQRVLFDLNADGLSDTLVFSSNSQQLLQCIYWNRELDTLHTLPPRTLFTYPAWDNLVAEISLVQGNTNDRYRDLRCRIEGTTIENEQSIQQEAHVILLNGYGFDLVDTVDFLSIQTFQDEPFIAAKVSEGIILKDIKSRDHSGMESAIIQQIPLSVYSKKAAEEERKIEIARQSASLEVFPNPANETIVVRSIIPEAEIPTFLELFSIEGKVVARQSVRANINGVLELILDVRQYSTGSYFLQITNSQGLRLNHQLIISR